MIQDVLIEPLKIIPREGGPVLHMLRADSAFFKSFGEIYFSWIQPNFIKGWKKHLKQAQHLAVPVGDVRVVLFDDRPGSLTYGQIQEIEIGENNYQLIRIPKNIWYAFKAIGATRALIANCTDRPHDPKEAVQIDISDSKIPYVWPAVMS